MCGLLAYWSKNQNIHQQQFLHSLKTLSHRGPDAVGIWQHAHKNIGLGHVRLRIMDLISGDQPLANHDNTIQVIVNGEFYGFTEIRQDLIRKGYQFKTHTDSEILIYLYEEYGTDCLRYLRGEFAFVLWDEKQNLFFAARDRFGIKPLFYTVYQDTLYFASEIKALLAMGIPAEWDVPNFLSWQNALPLQDRSMFKNIFPIKPGHFVIATPDNLQTVCYWDFNYPKQDEVQAEQSEAHTILAFRQQFEEAVSIRLKSDVAVGCYLSGGLDSCSVLAAMSAHQKTPIDTFTIAFKDKFYDESPFAAEMSQFVNARHHTFPVSEQLLCENFANAIFHSETMLLNNNAVAKFILSQKTRDLGYKVVLTGEGADEILGGYLAFRRDLLNYQSQDKSIDELNAMQLKLNHAITSTANILPISNQAPDLSQITQTLGYLPTFLEMGAANFLKTSQLFTQDFLECREQHHAQTTFLNSLDKTQLNGRNPVEKSFYLWSKSTLPGNILVTLGDRTEMAHSIEGRVPFLDHKLVEFLVNIPSSLKIKGFNEKYLLRQAMKDLIPKKIFERIKHPFMAPPTVSSHTNPLKQLMLDTFLGNTLKNNFFFDQKKVLALFKKVESMDIAKQKEWDIPFMLVLSTCVLENLFGLSVKF